MVHKDRRWWLNIKVEERPFTEGISDCKFYNLQKLWYLPALSSHCPHHKHLEWLKLMREQLWCMCLTNHKLKTSCSVNTSTQTSCYFTLSPKQGSCHCKYMHIIENCQWGTSMPDDMEQAHTKMTGQTDNEQLDISFICHLFSFLLWDASSYVHHGYDANFHHELCMA
jgi:hypothetical protein